MMRRPAPVLLALLLAPLLVAVPMLSAAGSPAYADAAATARPGTVREPLVRSTYALVVDQDTDEVLYEKNPVKVSSIASITKLMTAIVVLEAKLPLDEELVLGNEDRTSAGWWGSAMHPGVRMTRGEALHLALMSSENHAAHLLARTYPGGVEAAVDAMNARAALIGMADAHFADPTGLSPENRATAVDLVLLVKAAYAYPEIREFSTSREYRLASGRATLRYLNTNHLTSRPDWQIGLQKTGYTDTAGRCLVLQTVVEGRRVVMVLLDSFGKYSRFADAQRLRDWLLAKEVAAH